MSNNDVRRLFMAFLAGVGIPIIAAMLVGVIRSYATNPHGVREPLAVLVMSLAVACTISLTIGLMCLSGWRPKESKRSTASDGVTIDKIMDPLPDYIAGQAPLSVAKGSELHVLTVVTVHSAEEFRRLIRRHDIAHELIQQAVKIRAV